MNLVKNLDGRFRLHIWRMGTAFEYTNRYPLYQEWNNIKFSSVKPGDNLPYIFHYDIRNPLPYPQNTFNVVYCNHVAEHLTPDEGLNLVKDLYRVLEPGGVCRVVVPDLELAATEYINCLRQVISFPDTEHIRRYEWAVADLIDQMVRKQSGGVMWNKLSSGDVDWDQIRRCNGDVFEDIRTGKIFQETKAQPLKTKKYKLINKFQERWINKFKEDFYKILFNQFGVLKKPYVEVLNEKNMWMYDRFSLPELLKKGGFTKVTLCDYKTSGITNWGKYDFDRAENGDYPLEPSVYAEGFK